MVVSARARTILHVLRRNPGQLLISWFGVQVPVGAFEHQRVPPETGPFLFGRSHPSPTCPVPPPPSHRARIWADALARNRCVLAGCRLRRQRARPAVPLRFTCLTYRRRGLAVKDIGQGPGARSRSFDWSQPVKKARPSTGPTLSHLLVQSLTSHQTWARAGALHESAAFRSVAACECGCVKPSARCCHNNAGFLQE